MKWFYLMLLVKLIIAQQNGIRLPAEWESHVRTFLCWPQTDAIWYWKGIDLLTEVRKDVARIAKAIVDFEPVVIFCDPLQVDDARKVVDSRVDIVGMKLNDLWARDTLPVFTIENGQLKANIFNFNGWGNKQPHENDAQLAANVAQYYGFESYVAKMVAEGGSFETDGKGTLLVTESSVVNTNRNIQGKPEIEAEMKRVLGVRKVIWFKGVKGQDITDAHVDCSARFANQGTVIVNRPFPGGKPDVWSISSDDALNVLQSSTDADDKPFKIIELYEPDPDKILITGNATSFLASYVNFYIGNKFVIVPAFGDKDADLKAQSTLQEAFPERTIVPVPISALASGGGGIHCATHEQPALERR